MAIQPRSPDVSGNMDNFPRVTKWQSSRVARMYPGIWISKNIPFPALHTSYQVAIQPRSPDVSGNMDKHDYPVSRIAYGLPDGDPAA
jgi:hypothetical protein